jgi:tetratricopeptide (TPR) repeat protein
MPYKLVPCVGLMLALITVAHARDSHPPTAPVAVSKIWQASYTAEGAGNFEGALTALDDLPGPRATGYIAQYRRAWLQYRLGRYDQAAASYNAALALEPESIEARVALLAVLAAQAKWTDVVTGAEDVLKRDPANYLALSRLAFAKFSSQHFPDSEQLYRRLLQLYPSDVDGRAGLGWATLRMGKQKEASALFLQVLEVAPTHAIAHSGLEEIRNPKQPKAF